MSTFTTSAWRGVYPLDSRARCGHHGLGSHSESLKGQGGEYLVTCRIPKTGNPASGQNTALGDNERRSADCGLCGDEIDQCKQLPMNARSRKSLPWLRRAAARVQQYSRRQRLMSFEMPDTLAQCLYYQCPRTQSLPELGEAIRALREARSLQREHDRLDASLELSDGK